MSIPTDRKTVLSRKKCNVPKQPNDNKALNNLKDFKKRSIILEYWINGFGKIGRE